MRAQHQDIYTKWNWYFLLMTPGVVAFLFFFSDESPLETGVASALIAAPTLFFFGAHVLDRTHEGVAHERVVEPTNKAGAVGWTFALIALVCPVAASWFDHQAFIAEFFIILQLFIALAYMPALAMVVGINLVFLLFASCGILLEGMDALHTLVLTVGAIMFSAAIGKNFDILVLTIIYNQALLDELETQQEIIKQLSWSEGYRQSAIEWQARCTTPLCSRLP